MYVALYYLFVKVTDWPALLDRIRAELILVLLSRKSLCLYYQSSIVPRKPYKTPEKRPERRTEIPTQK